ncbi:MAG: hypothetical protein H6751_05485 [Candidatus Omnitrophica bacterium]|nr:hypothetical protein [Candidatus Omnitrophota bacterium]
MNSQNFTSDSFHSDELRNRWTDHFNPPALINDLGCFQVGPDPMAIRNFMFPPFSGKGEATAMLYVNGHHPATDGVKVGYTWYPDRVVRTCQMDGFEIETVTRATASDPAALIHLTIRNPGKESRKATVGIKTAGRLIHTIEGWASIGPEIDTGWASIFTEGHEWDVHPEKWEWDKALGALRFTSVPKAFSIQGTRPHPDRVESKDLFFDLELSPEESFDIHFVCALGETMQGAEELFRKLADDFPSTFQQAKGTWDKKIDSAFTPGNEKFSGNFPTLFTDEEDLARLYYHGAMGVLCCHRDNPLSQYGRTYVTLTPHNWTTASFLWDMMIAATGYAIFDPEILRKMIEVWLKADLQKYLATDYVTGKGLGYWYAVNNSAVVRLSYDYLRWSGDFDWLDKELNGKPILDHLEEHALHWHNLDHHGHGLADCGGVFNLLECVTTYIHEVAGFNALWVAAIRHVASFRKIKGQEDRAKELEKDADILLKNVLDLYCEGKGYWSCRQPDGSKNEIKHIHDFIAVLESIPGDLSDSMKKEMAAYFQSDHQTECWMRALSLRDDDVHRSFRVDWQWSGSYCSLPGQVVNGLYRIGHGELALDWLRRFSKVARQGPIGQAHWVETLRSGPEGGPLKCAGDPTHGTDWVCSANGIYPAMFIEGVFGIEATLTEGLKWRGDWGDFDPHARLENLCYQGKRYRVTKDGIEEITP